MSLVRIPLIELGWEGPVSLLRRDPARAAALIASARRTFGALPFALADRLSRSWLARSDNPFRREIEVIAHELGTGASLLNLSYEWGCTTGAFAAPDGRPRLVRVLDWPLDGLGANVVVARRMAPAGPLVDITWPGATGVVTAMAPGRFAVAMNQAPRTRHGLGFVGDWLVNRVALLARSRDIPPMHLLRRVCESAESFAHARAVLAVSPIAIPALFILAGTQPGECCVIERRQHDARVHDQVPAIAANAWLSDWPGAGRGDSNAARIATLAACGTAAGEDFAWLQPPVLNWQTRLAVVASAATGEVAVLGIEGERPATEVFAAQMSEIPVEPDPFA
jgi:hypothetical protein